MAVYRFRMQSILNIKEKFEEQAKQEFAVAANKLAREEEILAELCERKQSYIEVGIMLRNADSIDVRLIKENKEAVDRMDEFIEQQQIQVNFARKELEAARRKMMEARTQTQTYEKLKEKDFDAFIAEENRKESKEIDELNSYRSAIKAGK